MTEGSELIQNIVMELSDVQGVVGGGLARFQSGGVQGMMG